jgi:hypothetical protein
MEREMGDYLPTARLTRHGSWYKNFEVPRRLTLPLSHWQSVDGLLCNN